MPARCFLIFVKADFVLTNEEQSGADYPIGPVKKGRE
jgi:hypothetical protein